MQQQKGSVIEHYMAEERHPICIQVVNKHEQTEYYKAEEGDITSICIMSWTKVLLAQKWKRTCGFTPYQRKLYNNWEVCYTALPFFSYNTVMFIPAQGLLQQVLTVESCDSPTSRKKRWSATALTVHVFRFWSTVCECKSKSIARIVKDLSTYLRQ